MESFTDEMGQAVKAANDLAARKIEQALAEGLSIHFMRGGRIFERTREGDFELVRVGGALIRSDKAAPCR